MSLSRRVGRNVSWQLVGRFYTSLLAFAVISLLLPRMLTPGDFGVFAFHLTLYQLLNNVLDFGSGTMVVREASRDRTAAGRLIGMLVLFKARAAVLGFGVLVAVAWIFEGPGPRFLLLGIAALHLLFHAPAGAKEIFTVDMDFRRSIAATVAGQTAWLLGTAALAFATVERPAPYLLAYGLGPMVNGVLGYLWARRRVDITYDADAEQRRELWEQSWPAGVSMAMAATYFYIDAIMLRPLVGEEAVAQYSVAYRLMAFVLMVPVLFSQVVFPVVSRLWAAGPAALSPFFQRCLVVLASAGLAFPATVPLVAPDVMAVVYPPEYGQGAGCLAILSLAIVLVFCAYPHIMTLLAAGRQRVMMWISTAGVVINVTLNLWWVPRFGIEGAAWATVATEAGVVLAAAVCTRAATGLSLRPAPLLRPALAAAGAAGLLLLTLNVLDGSLPRLLAGLAAGALAVALGGAFPLELGTEEGAPPAAA